MAALLLLRSRTLTDVSPRDDDHGKFITEEIEALGLHLQKHYRDSEKARRVARGTFQLLHLCARSQRDFFITKCGRYSTQKRWAKYPNTETYKFIAHSYFALQHQTPILCPNGDQGEQESMMTVVDTEVLVNRVCIIINRHLLNLDWDRLGESSGLKMVLCDPETEVLFDNRNKDITIDVLKLIREIPNVIALFFQVRRKFFREMLSSAEHYLKLYEGEVDLAVDKDLQHVAQSSLMTVPVPFDKRLRGAEAWANIWFLNKLMDKKPEDRRERDEWEEQNRAHIAPRASSYAVFIELIYDMFVDCCQQLNEHPCRQGLNLEYIKIDAPWLSLLQAHLIKITGQKVVTALSFVNYHWDAEIFALPEPPKPPKPRKWTKDSPALSVPASFGEAWLGTHRA